MDVDLLNDAGRGGALVGPAEIEGVLDAEVAHHLDVVLGEVAEMVGAEKLPPAHRVAVAGRIAAEVSEIAGALEIEVTGREVCHRESLNDPVRQRNDVRCGWQPGSALLYTGFAGGRA